VFPGVAIKLMVKANTEEMLNLNWLALKRKEKHWCQ
jgi:hypothetical protein